MTGVEDAPIYPQYCFQVSPTIHKWCPLRAADVQHLTTQPGFAGQDLFFHINHPIKWVRIAGVVVAVDDYPGRRVYTIDDSSGVCIECSVAVPIVNTMAKAAVQGQNEAQPSKHSTKQPGPAPTVPIPAGLDVGSVVDIKGGVKLFRENKQIKAEKIVILRTTEQEVKFWDKVRQFRADVLGRPWSLSDKEVRKCRREAEGVDEEAAARRAKRKRMTTAMEKDAEDLKAGKGDRETRPPKAGRALGLERRQRDRRTQLPEAIKGKYSALGI